MKANRFLIEAAAMAQIAESMNAIPKRHSPRKVGKKIGRNEPCECGSGKKYKKCCLKN